VLSRTNRTHIFSKRFLLYAMMILDCPVNRADWACGKGWHTASSHPLIDPPDAADVGLGPGDLTGPKRQPGVIHSRLLPLFFCRGSYSPRWNHTFQVRHLSFRPRACEQPPRDVFTADDGGGQHVAPATLSITDIYALMSVCSSST
jgi:hypothetical protein